MGQVFRAEHTMMGRTVAIKVLPRYKSTPVAIASFTREIRAQAQLDHENLVRAFDAGHDGNVYFLVTECVPGSDLRKYVRLRGRLSMTEAATIISQAAVGLGHAHSRGLDPSRRQAGQPAGDDHRTHQSFGPGPGRISGRRRRRRSALGQSRRHGRLSGARADHHAQGRHAGQRRLCPGLHALLRGDGQGAVSRAERFAKKPAATAKKRRSIPNGSTPI